jgi:hypothetical protein
MWPFSGKKDTKTPENDPRSLESRMRALELDWEDTYDRIRKALQRISKRAEFVEKAEARDAQKQNGDQLSEARPNHPGAVTSTATGRMLTDRQREIQHAILKRRAGG